MGGSFSDGDAVQVDVGHTSPITRSETNSPCCDVAGGGRDDNNHTPTSLLPASLRAYQRQQDRNKEWRNTSPMAHCSPNLTASHIRNVLHNIDYHICTDTCSQSQQYDPASLQYMLDFFRTVAQSIPSDASGAGQEADSGVVPLEPGARDDSSKRAGIIVLREDLDFYVIPPEKNINQANMMEVKRAAARALLRQDGIFSGLKRSDEPGTTEAHLIEMLTAGYVLISLFFLLVPKRY
ncbi:hypothetical protein B0H66DRAFT_290665 [Apodospora peruviana]|uniref:Uncharacterized protein n=1 Tax=Apodospora peruviana TaxID=516989 RepID=A0AAE0I120_9PEZI|nr:hypothetical protein B0H66DRAFT_290665 [Apodospora peruviana]